MIQFCLLLLIKSDPIYSLVGSTLTISGDGIVTPVGVNSKAISLIVEVIIEEGISTIKADSFSKCENMRRISLPDSLIRMEACFSNTKLEEILIPINLKEITIPYIWTFTPLSKITVNASNKYFSSYGNCLLNRDQTHLYAFVNTPDFEFPSTLKSIGSWSFALKNNYVFKIPDNVTSISYQAFVDSSICTVIFSENSLLEEIPGRFFHQSANCSLIIPPKVKKINSEAFWGSRIKSISFYPGSQLSTLCDRAINDCGELKTIDLPKTIASISQSAFEGCNCLEQITVESGCEYLKDNGIYIWAPSEKKIIWVHHNVTQFTIEPDIEVICSSILQTCSNLSNIELDPHNKIFSLYDNVVYTQYHQKTYSVIGGIENCEIHSNCTTITASLFSRLTKLKRITFAPDSKCTKIEQYAFYLSSLESIEFADSITVIDMAILQRSLVTKVKFPPKLNSLGSFQFINNNPLTEVIFDENCPLQLLPIRIFQKCANLSKVVLPRNLRQILSRSFHECGISSIEIPSMVQSIADEAFADCYSLCQVNFSEVSNCATISIAAFRSAAIESIILPKSLVTLSSSAFANCSRLTNVTFEAESLLTSLISQTFMGCKNLKTFLIPKGITDVDPTTFYKCNRLTNFDVDSRNEKYESTDGVVYEKSPKALALFPPGKETAIVLNGTVRISDNAFYGCSALNSLDFGTSSIESIGELTFFECTSLSSIIIPRSVENILARAFEGCISMTSIEFANESRILSIGSSTFSGCGNLTTVKFPPNSLLEKIEDSTFADCILLSDFTFPKKVNSIGYSAFKNCESLRSVILNETGIDTISDEAFKGCHALSTISLPNQLIIIGNMAFEGTAIKNLIIPTNIEELGIGCFSQCKSLKKVIYCGQRKFESAFVFAGSVEAIAFTLFNYQYPSFCGVQTLKVMKKCGVFPTVEFTDKLAGSKISGAFFISIALSETSLE